MRLTKTKTCEEEEQEGKERRLDRGRMDNQTNRMDGCVDGLKLREKSNFYRKGHLKKSSNRNIFHTYPDLEIKSKVFLCRSPEEVNY